MVVVARAGSGKTTTLEQLAQLDPKQGLYVVYNSANRKEAQRRFPNHVKPVTGHSLAFRPMIIQNPAMEAKFKAAQDGRRIPLWTIVNEGNLRGMNGITANKMAGMVLRTIGAFQNSADSQVGTHHVPEDCLPASLRVEASRGRRQDIEYEVCRAAAKIWSKMENENSPFPILHDTYLKLFQLRDPVIHTEQILADEFQDANPVIQAIIERQGCQKIYVGDPCQAIYGWRGAVNALDDARNLGRPEYNLSISFRFGNQVAALANLLLKVKGESVLLRGGGPASVPFNESKPHAVIARNNATLFEHAVRAIEDEEPFALVGGAEELIKLVESGYALYRGEFDKVRNDELKNYVDWDELKDITEITQDASMRHLIMVIEKYKSDSIGFSHELRAAGKTNEDSVRKVLTTAHKSKGREFQQTHLCDDLELDEGLIQKVATGGELTMGENEVLNLLYVAITRCKTGLNLEAPLKENLRSIREVVRTMAAPDVHEAPAATMGMG